MAAQSARQGCWRNLGRKATLLAALLLAWGLRAATAARTKIVCIGVLASAEQHPIQSIKERLRKLGWIEGETVRFDPPKILAALAG